jgi:hypothetical protein
MIKESRRLIAHRHNRCRPYSVGPLQERVCHSRLDVDRLYLSFAIGHLTHLLLKFVVKHVSERLLAGFSSLIT